MVPIKAPHVDIEYQARRNLEEIRREIEKERKANEDLRHDAEQRIQVE